MITLCVQISKNPVRSIRFMYGLQKIVYNYNLQSSLSPYRYATTVDALDAFTFELTPKHRNKADSHKVSNFSMRSFMESDNVTMYLDVSKMTIEELDDALTQIVTKNKDKQLVQLILDCRNVRKQISEDMLKKLFRKYSGNGKTDVVEVLMTYTSKVNPYLHKRNGQFMHYLAKAQCMRGNSEKGLTILTECYNKNENFRNFYRAIFRELIQDSVLNRSEASMVVFKKYVLEFSRKWNDNYPLVCFWHICWSSTWFSDQMLSNDLVDASTALQEIIRDKAGAFCISILKQEYNDDAVVRLLQTLLKYEMLTEYVKVLQILFTYKLKNRDLRGCTEIIRNCEALGITLPIDQQGKYIKMLIIGGKHNNTNKSSTKPTSKNFRLKF